MGKPRFYNDAHGRKCVAIMDTQRTPEQIQQITALRWERWALLAQRAMLAEDQTEDGQKLKYTVNARLREVSALLLELTKNPIYRAD